MFYDPLASGANYHFLLCKNVSYTNQYINAIGANNTDVNITFDGSSDSISDAPTIASITPIAFKCAFILFFILLQYDYILISLPKRF